MNIIKRDGTEAVFDKNKIINAIKKANNEESEIHRLNDVQILAIADNIEQEVSKVSHATNVEDIQDMVEVGIMSMRGYEVAQKYVRYRYKKNISRQGNTIDGAIMSLIDLNNEEIKQENSNKNPVIVSTQRDYMAGEVSKDITKRFLLDPDIWEAHVQGIIHFHDADYFGQKIHNCFTGDTKFLTNKGVKQFDQFESGEIVYVKDKDGVLRKATVRNYGDQKMNEVILSSDNSVETIHCTANHRWILEDGSITTELKVGDKLYPSQDSTLWTVESINPKEIAPAWCVEEPVTHSFTLDKGIVTGNCCLINLEDMLQNGTVISGTMIEKPKSFITACNIATQIVAQVASSQYGGQTFSLSHLAPFVDISRQKIREEVNEEFKGLPVSQDYIEDVVKKRLRKNIRQGIQTIQYQLVTLQTTNGQTPFVTMFMYLDEVPEGQTRDDLAIMIEEVLNQRIKGLQNEQGVWVTPAFPKLVYALDEDNIHDDSKYFYLTELAAKCTAKRMVPDYVSVKKMMELKGSVYPPMGCVDKNEVITYKFHGELHVESFKRMWNRLSKEVTPKSQGNGGYYIQTTGLTIWDSKKKDFTKVYGVIKNAKSKYLRVTLSNGRILDCTIDHPFETENRGVVHAKDLVIGKDQIMIDFSQYSEETKEVDSLKAWALGVLLYESRFNNCSVYASSHIQSIITRLKMAFKDSFEHDAIAGSFDEEGVGIHSVIKAIKSGDLAFKLAELFGGEDKIERHIPSEVFSYNREAKLAFLAGTIDADGCLNEDNVVKIGTFNKELALQELALFQSVGVQARVYIMEYHTDEPFANVAYVVEADLTDEIKNHMSYNMVTSQRHEFNIFTHEHLDDQIAVVVNVEVLRNQDVSYDVTTESEHFTVSGVYSHNCRSFLTPDRSYMKGNLGNAKNFKEGERKFYGRFNQGVVTINLPDVALSSGGDMDKFWEIFEERLELCHRALQARNKRLRGTVSDVAPIQWQNGCLARLKKGETIDRLLFDGYSTISLGYAGLYECVKYMTGKSHTDDEAKPFALSVMKKLNDKCAEWKAAENIDYSVYGTPIESTTYKFAKCLQKRFGIIEGVTDKNYITNSYHVHVTEEIDAFTKLTFEAEFQELSPGGAISYVEVPNMQNNIPAVIAVMRHIYDKIIYAELNTKSDYCMKCGYDGEIKIQEDPKSKKLYWQCPNCGNTDQNKMSVVRRTCGYLGTQYWNQGRTQEIQNRVLHL